MDPHFDDPDLAREQRDPSFHMSDGLGHLVIFDDLDISGGRLDPSVHTIGHIRSPFHELDLS